MVNETSTSIILPTMEWNKACEEISAQLREGDELLVVCDTESDPATTHLDRFPTNSRLVVAGEPEACSGKANAIAAGMEAAHNDRIIWTDDDFHHSPDWLEELQIDYERYGPTSELPVFVGQDPLAVLLEPVYVIGGTLGIYANDFAWGGSVIFEREDLDEEAFLTALRRTVSDDGLLSEYVNITTVRRTRQVDIGGSLRETLERHVRFTKIVHYHSPESTLSTSIVMLLTAGCILFPLPALAILTVMTGGVYAMFGIHRWSFLLAYPTVLAAIPLLMYSLARRSFVWGGRRYRWHSKFDVTVEPE